MLDVKEAVTISLKTFEQLFPSEWFREPRLEEVALTRDEQNWRITISYKNPDLEEEIATQQAEGKSITAALTGSSSRRVATRHYKSINIKADNGSLVAIKSKVV